MVTLVGQGGRMILQVASVAVLARLLSPEDYGLLAMVTVIVGIGEIFRDFGLSSAAIQAPELSREQRSNLFWINTAIGALLATAVASGASLIAALYQEPELADVARVLSVTFLLNGLATQYRADLVRGLRFTRVAAADLAAPFVALGTAVVTAVAGWGYWALVAQSLVQSLVLLVGYVLAARWLPGLPSRRAPMRGLLTFGWKLVGTQLIGYASNNTDAFVIGLRFGPVPLGYYNRAFRLLMTPLVQLRAPTTTIALPVLSKLQNDPERFGAYVRRGQQALGYTLVAGLGFVAAAAEPVTTIFLGDRWTSVVPILRLLALAGMFQTLAYVGYWVYLARNLAGDLLRFTILTAALRVVCIVVGSHWGIVGVAAGYAATQAFEWPLSLWWLGRRAAAPTRVLIVTATRMLTVALVAAAPAVGSVRLLASAGAPLQLLGAAAATATTYALAWLLVRPVRADISEVVEIVRIGLRRPGRGPGPVTRSAE
jgi:PST family polysaccharide transporter